MMHRQILTVLAASLIGFMAACGSPSSESEPGQVDPIPEPQVESEPVVEPSPPKPESNWRTSQSTNPLDDSRTMVAVLEATTGTGGMLEPEPISLVVRCQSNRTEAYINWHDFLGDDDLDNIRSTRKRVTYRFPPATAETGLWGVSTDNDATFVPRAIPFLRTLVESEQLVVQTIPYNEAPSTAIFDLDGAMDALALIAETCEWTLDPEQARQEQAARDRAQQERRRAAEERRRAEQERILAGLINRPITSGLQGPIGRSAGGAYGTAGLPAPVGQARFPGVTSGQLSRARSAGGYTITCPRGEWSGDEVTLLDCTLQMN